MKFSPRPYQKKAIDSVISRYHNGSTRMLLHLPTGAGKTVIATLLVEKLLTFPGMGKILFIAHREEILDQTYGKLKNHLPGLNIQIEQGTRSTARDAQITIASVQSLIRRKKRFDPREFSVIICDECHRALAPSWTDVITYFYENKRPDTLLLGMTATPRRSDGRSALTVFNEIAYEISRVELQNLGYLVPMSYYTVRTELNLDQVKMSGGDFQVGSLTKIMNTREKRALALTAWQEKGRGKKTIAFCAGVAHARQLAADFVSNGIKAGVIDAKTTKRREILNKFRKNELEILTNYGVLTEGFDDPGIECILLVRPTTSPLVYTQCIGRGLRPNKGKNTCTVIDMIDRSAHQLQYGVADMCGLPEKWRSSGSDPYRESEAISRIKISAVDAFLKIKQARSLEEVQEILMSIPPESVTAGLDGEPVLYYEPCAEKLSAAKAKEEARKILQQAHAPIKKIAWADNTLKISLASPEINNEKYSYVKWHLQRVTGRPVTYREGRKKGNPRAFLNSMLNENQKIKHFAFNEEDNSVIAWINNLSHDELSYLSEKFKEKTGMDLKVRGQTTLF
ncbi:MAG: DEAD/DEAH box helicase [Desulfobacterales bacterium]|nr:DEAD/DEAH box helicase [Desulfobacterales bacterium]